MGLERKLNVYMFLFPERQLGVLIVKKDENKIRLKQVCCDGKWWSRDRTAALNWVSVRNMTVEGGSLFYSTTANEKNEYLW